MAYYMISRLENCEAWERLKGSKDRTMYPDSLNLLSIVTSIHVFTHFKSGFLSTRFKTIDR